MAPFKTKYSGEVKVPCGKCPDCRATRVSGWSFRLMQEERQSSTSYFITLTYDNDSYKSDHPDQIRKNKETIKRASTPHVPITPSGFMGLRKEDVQLYIKRLRKLNAGQDLRYYCAAEYGGQTKRPHYHIILFNARLATIQVAWGLGNVDIGGVSGASVGYTLKYISKPSKIPQFKGDDRLKEFSLMSKGLGLAYLSPAMVAWHLNDLDNRMYCNLKDGKKATMPRYFKDKLYTKDQRESIAKQATKNVIEKLEENLDNLLDPDYIINTQEDIAAAYTRMLSPDTKNKI